MIDWMAVLFAVIFGYGGYYVGSRSVDIRRCPKCSRLGRVREGA